MIRRGSDVLTYDADNRLTSVQRNSGDPVPFDYSLQKDWNVVSFPYLPADKSVLNVLSGLTFGTDYDQVSYYDAANNEWKHFVNDPLFNDFESFEYGKAYHVFIKNASGVNFTVTGNLSEFSETFDLKVGNNYFSTIRATNNVISDVLAGVTYTDVLEFDAAAQTWVSVPVSNELQLGKGYAIQVSADDNFTISTEVLNITYAYGPNGDRIKMTSPSGTTTYVGSAFEKRGTNETKYVFLDDFRIAEFRTNGGLFFLHTDHLNSTNVVTDSAGLQVQRYEYKPYGQTAYTDNPQGASFTHKFTGQKEDADASLYYYNARYYDPELGRFIQADSFVQSPYDPQSFNRYSYVLNNPVKFSDPTGNFAFLAPILAAAIKGALIGAAIGAAIGGISSAIAGGNVLEGALKGAISGAITGAITGGVGKAFELFKAAGSIEAANVGATEAATATGSESLPEALVVGSEDGGFVTHIDGHLASEGAFQTAASQVPSININQISQVAVGVMSISVAANQLRLLETEQLFSAQTLRPNDFVPRAVRNARGAFATATVASAVLSFSDPVVQSLQGNLSITDLQAALVVRVAGNVGRVLASASGSAGGAIVGSKTPAIGPIIGAVVGAIGLSAATEPYIKQVENRILEELGIEFRY